MGVFGLRLSSPVEKTWIALGVLECFHVSSSDWLLHCNWDWLMPSVLIWKIGFINGSGNMEFREPWKILQLINLPQLSNPKPPRCWVLDTLTALFFVRFAASSKDAGDLAPFWSTDRKVKPPHDKPFEIHEFPMDFLLKVHQTSTWCLSLGF